MTTVEFADPPNDLPTYDTPPLLSVIVPVYNGARKLENTLQNIQGKVDTLYDDMFSLELERYKIEHALLTTGQIPVIDDSMPAGEDMSSGGLAVEKINEILTGGLVQQVIPVQVAKSVQNWYEIIVVNDGSKDDTRNVIEKLVAKDQRIKSISYSVNMGKGYAIKQGVLHSNGKYVLFLDGDGDISADVLAKYLKRLSKVHIVIGSKNHKRSIVNTSASRRFLSRCFQIFAKVSLGLKVGDTQVGLKAGRGEVFRKIFERVQVRRYAFDAEMLAIAGLMDLKIVELPVKINLDKAFKKKEIVRMAFDVLAVAFRLRVIKWYQKNSEKKRPQYRLPMFF